MIGTTIFRFKAFLTLALAAALLSAASPASAEYPERPIKFVVPYAAGGSSDIVGRLFAERLEKRLGQPVVIENAGGAGGALGAQRVANAAPDDYTLLIGSGSELLIRKLLQPTPYDGLRDFLPIAMIGTGPMVVVGKRDLAASTLPDVLALAKAKPGSLNYGSAGHGTFMHLVGEAMKSRTKVSITHVAYRGAAPLMTDVIAGHVELGVASLASALPFIEAGQAQAYAVSSKERVAFAPNIPAFSEFPELADFELELWIGLFAPAKGPRSRRGEAARRLARRPGRPGAEEEARHQAIAVRKLAGEELAAFLAGENEKYRKIIADGHITAQ